MTTILHLDSSARLEGSTTRRLTAKAIEELKIHDPNAKIIRRDLAREPLPYPGPAFVAGIAPSASETSAALPEMKISDQLVGEVLAADILVMGVPMYNFSVPSQLKAWIDYICRAGKTFRYAETGPQGLAIDKKAILMIGSGGVYSEGPWVTADHVTPYLKTVLGFIGITDVEVVRAEKQALGAQPAAEGWEEAQAQLQAVFKHAA